MKKAIRYTIVAVIAIMLVAFLPAKFAAAASPGIDINDARIILSSRTYSYTGERLKPTVIAKYNGEPLTKGEDYDVRYINNLEVGTATVVIKGKGDFYGTTTLDFNIRLRNLSSCDISLEEDSFSYTGDQILPEVEVQKSGSTISEDNYRLTYVNNVEVGDAYVLVLGKNNCSGLKVVKFSIDVSGKSVAEFASSNEFLGIPYVWGGTTKDGFDCSGFVQYVYFQFGYTLNRTADAQSTQGTRVDRSELKPGDLVFFSGYGHVGIYIGDDKFVHASNSGIKVSSLVEDETDGTYYATRYCGATRII